MLNIKKKTKLAVVKYILIKHVGTNFANIWRFWLFINWVIYFKHIVFLSGINIYLFVDLFLNTWNKIAKLFVLFTIFINLGSHASIKYIVIPREKTLCFIIGQIFLGRIARLFLIIVKWINWKRCDSLFPWSKPEFPLLLF